MTPGDNGATGPRAPLGSGPDVSGRPRPLKRVSARAVRSGARWAVLAGLVTIAAVRIDWGGVGDSLARGSLALLAAAALLNVASSACKAVTWQGLVAALPSARGRTRRGDLVSPLLVGALVNSVGVARAGDVVKVALARRALARRGADVAAADIAGAMVAEHVVATAAWGALICAIAAVAPVPAPVWAASLAVGVACLALVVVTALRPPGDAGCRVGSGPSLVRRALRAVGRAWAAVHHSHRGLGRPGVLAWVAPAAVGQWVCAWLAIAAVLRSLGLGHVGLTGAGVVLAGVTLAHALPVTPGGVGIIQAGAALPLTATYGVAPEDAIAVAVALAVSETGPGVLLGALCAAREGACANWPRRHRPIGIPAPAPPGNVP